MKTCPICNAVTFDDAETCFGCMHRFADSEGDASDPAGHIDLPRFLITMTPIREGDIVNWSFEVETA